MDDFWPMYLSQGWLVGSVQPQLIIDGRDLGRASGARSSPSLQSMPTNATCCGASSLMTLHWVTDLPEPTAGR